MANDDDIFSQLDNQDDNDRTVLNTRPGGENKTLIKPTPGRKKPLPSHATTNTNQQSAIPQRPIANLHNVLDKTENNSLLSVAKPLLSLLTRLSQTHQHNDVSGLHGRTLLEIQNFDTYAQQKHIDPQQCLIARYVLCAAIDETVLNTPWGSNSLWPNKSMLSTFHRENTGGQKFFTLLERLQQNPAQNIDLLELMATCLALGFQGKYRVMQGGYHTIESLRTQLHQQITMIRGEYERSLSPHVRGVNIKQSTTRRIPVWIIAAVTAAILISTYVGLSLSLNNAAAPVLDKLQQINPVEKRELNVS
ncbi:MAG TPA: DotU family type IV/VI secretion system protein [Gammaproteobacteria bacterium]|nr:DotU family type IV/VI secretion system protein [Gammaproteobacteria bacterium]